MQIEIAVQVIVSGRGKSGHDGLRQRFVHDPHTAHSTDIMGTGVFTKPFAPSLV
jgi:hypothetical protein